LVSDPPPGPARAAGIESGDVIVRIEEVQITGTRALVQTIAQSEVGAMVEIEILRDGETIRRDVILERRERAVRPGVPTGRADPEARSPEGERIGMEFSDITPALRGRMDLPDGIEGAVITAIAPGSPAGDKGLRAGDVIVEASRASVSGAADLSAAFDAASTAGQRVILLRVLREGQPLYAGVPVSVD
jgi:serine protease Do